jgi:alpha-tubulin suppressor-like RCC1 family protein
VSYDKKGWNHFLGIVFQKGQLGLGDFSTRSSPTVVTALSKYKVVKAAAGRAHTVVVTSKGESLAFGFNKHGQLGAGFVKEESEKSPVRSLVTDATFVACGAEFTIWLTSIEGATVM